VLDRGGPPKDALLLARGLRSGLSLLHVQCLLPLALGRGVVPRLGGGRVAEEGGCAVEKLGELFIPPAGRKDPMISIGLATQVLMCHQSDDGCGCFLGPASSNLQGFMAIGNREEGGMSVIIWPSAKKERGESTVK